MKKILFALLCLALSFGAQAQFVPGQVLTAQQLNTQFGLYLPLTGGTLTGPLTVPSITITGGGTIPGTTGIGPAVLQTGPTINNPVINGIVSGSAQFATTGTATFGGITATPISGSTGSFTTLAASGVISGAGFTTLLGPYLLSATAASTYLAITTAASTYATIAQATTALAATGGTITGVPVSGSTGSFTTLAVSGTITGVTGRLLNVQVFTASGTYTPTTGTNSVIVEVQAASGGAAGVLATGATQSAAGSGAGSGAYAKVRFTSGFSGATVTIGAAGAAGGSGTAGGNAAATSFGALVSCPGGNAGGLGALVSATGGSVVGAAATSAPTISGGTTIVSVAGAGTGPSQVLLASGGQAIASSGADSILGTGGALTGVTTSAPVAGNGYGAGPSGGINTASSAAQVGLAGRPGIVIVYEYQ